jgi:hypothetical protein
MIDIFTSTCPTVLRSGTRMKPFCNRLKCDAECDESMSVVCDIAILVRSDMHMGLKQVREFRCSLGWETRI